MNGTQLAAKVRKYTSTNSTSYTDAIMLPDVNDAKNELANLIAQRNESLFMMPSTGNLVASDVNAREYPLPDDMLNHFFTVEAAFDSANPTVFVPVIPYPGGMQRAMKELNGITEAKIANYFTNTQPYYFKIRKGIYILSGTIKAVTNGLRIRYRLLPADLANLSGTQDLGIDPTTTSFGIPLQFHELWARRVSIIWKSSRPKPVSLSPLEMLYERDLETALSGIGSDDYGDTIIGSLPDEDSPQLLGGSV